MVTLETTTLLKQLKIIACEDYGVDYMLVNAEFSYEMVNQRGNPPIIISNDRQVSNFVSYTKKSSSTTLCVTLSATGAKEKERVNIDLNKEPFDSSNFEDEEVPETNQGDFAIPSKESTDKTKNHVAKDGFGDAVLRSENNGERENNGQSGSIDFVKKDQIFQK